VGPLKLLSESGGANRTNQFGVTNSWGVSSIFQTYDNVAHIPPPPNEEYFLMTFFGFLLVGLYFLGKIAKRAPALKEIKSLRPVSFDQYTFVSRI